MISKMIRRLLLSILATVSLVPVSSSASPFSDRYDLQIRAAVRDYWPAYPYWRAWKAQLYQESRLDPGAVSPVGAQGLAQFMPGTWRQVSAELKLGEASPHTDIAISAGAFYMAKRRSGWSSPRPEADRHRLAAASYNAGFGNLLKAQKACGDRSLYVEIIACLPEITGQHSAETISYVRLIWKWWRMMEAGL